MDNQQRKRFIYDQVGEEALNYLKESGLEIDNAISNIIKEQKKQMEKLEILSEYGTIEDI